MSKPEILILSLRLSVTKFQDWNVKVDNRRKLEVRNGQL